MEDLDKEIKELQKSGVSLLVKIFIVFLSFVLSLLAAGYYLYH